MNFYTIEVTISFLNKHDTWNANINIFFQNKSIFVFFDVIISTAFPVNRIV